jgi:RNA polymerase-binding transcription factor DksA
MAKAEPTTKKAAARRVPEKPLRASAARKSDAVTKAGSKPGGTTKPAKKEATPAKSAGTMKAAKKAAAAPVAKVAKKAPAPKKTAPPAKAKAASPTKAVSPPKKSPAPAKPAAPANKAKPPATAKPAAPAGKGKAPATAKPEPAPKKAEPAKAEPVKKPARKTTVICPLSGFEVKPDRPNLSPRTIERLKTKLLDERARHLNQADQLQAEAAQLAMDREEGDTQFDEEGGEGDTISVERERDLMLSASAREIVEEIDRALERMKNRTYGLCTPAGRRIAVERLEALPYAETCVDCKARAERRR